jgi:hypothetical protein
LDQGDQIGRLFAYWVIVYFGQCFENLQKYIAQIFGLLFPRYQLCFSFDQKRLGYILGDIFKNSSGHPGLDFKAQAAQPDCVGACW